MTPETQRALERLPGEFGPDDLAQAIAERELKARSRKLLETLDRLCAQAVRVCRLPHSESARVNLMEEAQEARALLRETTRAMLSEK